MTKTAEDRLRKANKYLQEAELLYREKIGNLHVLANLYHAMMNCLFALLDIRDIGNLTHADVIENFEKEYMQTEVFSRKFSDALHFSYHITHECDCDRMKPPEDKNINKLLPLVREFVHRVTTYLKKEY